ncbi:MAG: MFS transporter [Pseudonocardiaceae bacterium]
MTKARRGGLWHHRDFRRLWVGDTISQFGTTISRLALPLLAVLVLDASTFEVGLLVAFETVAFLLIGLPAGVWVDRMRRRRVLIVNDLVRAVAIGSLPVAHAAGVLSIEQLYCVAFISGVGTVFFDVAYQSYLPELIGRDDLVEGNAKLQASQSVAQVAGPSGGGALVQTLTAPYALLVDAVSYLWSAMWVGAISVRPPRPQSLPGRSLRRELADGLRFVWGNRPLRAITMTTGVANLFEAASSMLLLVLLARTLSLPPGLIGLPMSTAAVGGLLGTAVAVRVARRIGQGAAICASVAMVGVAGLVAPFVHRGWTFVLLLVAQFMFGVGVVIYNITQVSFRQRLCPPALLGRMNATIRFVVFGTIPLGGLLGGALGSGLGVRTALLVTALGGLLALVPALASPLPRMRELPTAG